MTENRFTLSLTSDERNPYFLFKFETYEAYIFKEKNPMQGLVNRIKYFNRQHFENNIAWPFTPLREIKSTEAKRGNDSVRQMFYCDDYQILASSFSARDLGTRRIKVLFHQNEKDIICGTSFELPLYISDEKELAKRIDRTQTSLHCYLDIVERYFLDCYNIELEDSEEYTIKRDGLFEILEREIPLKSGFSIINGDNDDGQRVVGSQPTKREWKVYTPQGLLKKIS